MIRVPLTWEEMIRAADEGVRRRVDAIVKGRRHRHGFKSNGLDFDTNILGTVSEMAACRALGTYWGGNERDAGGVDGTFFEVRAVTHAGHRLIIHDCDRDDLPFILAHVDLPIVNLIGFISGERAKAEFPIVEPQAGRPCRLIPHSGLCTDWPALRNWIARQMRSKPLDTP